jgi:protein subunit release factor B
MENAAFLSVRRLIFFQEQQVFLMDHPYMSPETIAAIRERMRIAGIREEDLEERFVLGSGSGGQKINKTSSAVFLRHAPSGEAIKLQSSRSREINRWLARRALAERLLEKIEGRRSARQQEMERVRRQKRRRSRRQKANMLADKHHHAAKKSSRARVDFASE